MSFLGIFPDCARRGCLLPGIFKINLISDGRAIQAFLCPICVTDLPTFMKEVAAVREQDRLMESRERLTGPAEGEPSGEDPLE